MRIGINHQILPSTNAEAYEGFWNAVSPWIDLIRLAPHMDAYAYRVDFDTTYSNGAKPSDSFNQIGKACKAAKIGIDFIRDDCPVSPNWKALGGDWSSFDNDDWRDNQLPKEVWTKTNQWINAAAKTLVLTGAPNIRWQGANEQFYRGKDGYAYERLKTIYSQPTYSRPWSTPVLWGSREQLMRSLQEWLVLEKYEKAMQRTSYVALNVYPDWVPGVTVDVASNVARQIENLILVNSWAEKNNKEITISEFGFAKQQIPSGEEERVTLTAFVIQCMKLLPRIAAAALYYDAGDYHISDAGLAQLGELIQAEPNTDHHVYIGGLSQLGYT